MSSEPRPLLVLEGGRRRHRTLELEAAVAVLLILAAIGLATVVLAVVMLFVLAGIGVVG